MKLKHFDIDGQARFITFCTHNQLPLLSDNKIRRIILDIILDAKKQYGFKLIAYVLMPEHVHLILIPNENSKVGHIIGEIKRLSSKKIHKYLILQKSKLIKKLTVIRNGAERFVFWRKRCYDHNCRSEESLWEKVNYCHNNPVKRGLVQSPEKWQWSSYQYYRCNEVSPLNIDIIG